jgi:uncharacterized repeat protein (TIGR03803 family)
MRPMSIRPAVSLAMLAASWTTYAQGAAFSSLYTFPGSPAGSNPQADVTIGKGGVLYGTTVVGGSAGYGTVFSLTRPASPGGAWIPTVLHSFGGAPNDGYSPYNAGVAIGKGGVLYGTTYGGGSGFYGTVFALTPPAGVPSEPGLQWAETILYNFTGNSDGGSPQAAVVIGRGGVLYGTTNSGGTGACSGGCGTVFALTPPVSPGGPWTETVLHNFTGGPGDGASPITGVVIGSGGVLYGTTVGGGSAGYGTVFSLTPPAGGPSGPSGTWSETVLYNFTGASDGSVPAAGVAIGKGGVLFGTTYGGGTGICSGGCGTVFALSPPESQGGLWTEIVLHSFAGGSTDGAFPSAGVVFGSGAMLYGTTYSGGSVGYGTVFTLKPPGSPGGSWTETVLHNFAGGRDGAFPFAGVAIGSDGRLFGTAENGGSHACSLGCGTMFRLKP